MYLKQKEKNKKKKNLKSTLLVLLLILNKNKKKSIMIRLRHILIFQKFFSKKLFETKDKKKNSEFVEKIKMRWNNLKDEIEKMSKSEIKNEKPNEILRIVNEIIDFHKEI